MQLHHDDLAPDTELQFPQAFVSDLISAHSAPTQVPGHVDEAIIAQARLLLARQRRSRLVLRWCMPAAAAAAICLFVGVSQWSTPNLVRDRSFAAVQTEAESLPSAHIGGRSAGGAPIRSSDRPAHGPADLALRSSLDHLPVAPGHEYLPIPSGQDIDASGQVDILDALALARSIKTGVVAGRPWDFNDDGIIDRRDVDTVAMSAVRLDQETTQ